jgi:hypothetical protein
MASGGKINDRKPPVTQTHRSIYELTFSIGAAMAHHGGHPLQQSVRDGFAMEINYANDATHELVFNRAHGESGLFRVEVED